MNRIALLLIFIVSIGFLHAQQSFKCGTVITPQQAADELSLNKAAFTVPDLCLKKEISIYAYIVKDSLGITGITPADINAGIAIVNTYFAPICLSFKVCKFIYIDNWKYDKFHQKKEEDEVRNLYCTPKAINMFFVKTIEDPAGVAGYAPLATSLPANPNDIIVIQKSSAAAGLVITHELGHFFGLYHTFETQFGAELVDGSNCATAGDRICDTEADIDPGTGTVPCPYTGVSKDLAGNFYMPPVGNIMAYHSCKCKFTTGQYNRMAFVFLNFRKYLL